MWRLSTARGWVRVAQADQAVRWFGWAAAAIILIAAATATHARLGLERDIAERKTSSAAVALSSFTGTVLGTMESVLGASIAHDASPGGVVDADAMSRKLAALQRSVSFIRTLLLVDARTGFVVADGRADRPALGFDVGDRAYLRVHLDAPPEGGAGGVFIDRPVRSRVDGNWSLPLSRAIRDADGRPRWVFVTSISIEYLTGVFRDVAADAPLSVLMVHRDGTVLAGWPLPEGRLGQSVAATSALLREHLPRGETGGFQAVSPVDGVERLVQYRVVEGHPVIIAVGRPAATVRHVAFAEVAPWLAIAVFGALAFALGGEVISRSLRATRRALIEAERADARKSQFLANTSHELRTPLNAILGYAEVVRDDVFATGLPDRYRRYGAAIHESGRHLLALVNDLLDLNQLDRDRVVMDTESVPLSALFEEAVRLAWAGGEDAPRVEMPDGDALAGLALDCDRRRLVQALVNLLANALRHTPPHGAVRLDVERDAAHVVLVVADSGPGLPLGLIDKLGEPFALEGDPYLTRKQGTGLGLPITQRIAVMHGGRLAAANARSGGAVMRLMLPAARLRGLSAVAAAQ